MYDEDAYPHRLEEDRYPSFYDAGGYWARRHRPHVDAAYWVFDQRMVAMGCRPDTEELIIEAMRRTSNCGETVRWMDTLFDIRNLDECDAPA